MSYAFISRYYRDNYYYGLLTEFISYLIYFLIILIIIISFKIHKYINTNRKINLFWNLFV